MNFSIIISLCFQHFLIYQVSSLQNSSLVKAVSRSGKINNVLEMFFNELDKTYLQRHVPRHVTILGASNYDLPQAQLLTKSYPSIICRKTNECDYQKQYGRGSFVIMFLSRLVESTFKKNMKFLSLCRNCKILFVSNAAMRVRDVRFIFDLVVEENLPHAQFAQLDKNVIELYGYVFTQNCSLDVKLINIWKPGDTLNNMKKWSYSVSNLNGCTILVSSLNLTPKMIISEEKSGSLTITGGQEGLLLLEISKILNFSIVLQYPAVEDRTKYSRKDAVLRDVLDGIADIGIGRLRPTNALYEMLDLSVAYDEDCVTWGVPRIMIWSNALLIVEFSWQLWAAVGLVFAVSCAIGYALRSIISPKSEISKVRGFVAVVLDGILITLGNSVTNVPSTSGGKFLLLNYLYYAMVITTAYKTSLASILTINEATPFIVDVQTMLDSNLSIGGAHHDYNILKDQSNESELTQQLLDRFVINNNDSETWNQLLFDRNYGLLTRYSYLNYFRQKIAKAKKCIPYDVIDNCVLAYYTVMAFQKKSMLRHPVNRIIEKFTENGILEHWDNEQIDVNDAIAFKDSENFSENGTISKFRSVFILYLGCILSCILTFFLELLASRLRKKIKKSKTM